MSLTENFLVGFPKPTFPDVPCLTLRVSVKDEFEVDVPFTSDTPNLSARHSSAQEFPCQSVGVDSFSGTFVSTEYGTSCLTLPWLKDLELCAYKPDCYHRLSAKIKMFLSDNIQSKPRMFLAGWWEGWAFLGLLEMRKVPCSGNPDSQVWSGAISSSPESLVPNLGCSWTLWNGTLWKLSWL